MDFFFILQDIFRNQYTLLFALHRGWKTNFTGFQKKNFKVFTAIFPTCVQPYFCIRNTSYWQVGENNYPTKSRQTVQCYSNQQSMIQQTNSFVLEIHFIRTLVIRIQWIQSSISPKKMAAKYEFLSTWTRKKQLLSTSYKN